MIGVPLVPWSVLVALWELRAVIGFAILGLWLYFWLCRRHPYAAVFVYGFIRGLFGR